MSIGALFAEGTLSKRGQWRDDKNFVWLSCPKCGGISKISRGLVTHSGEVSTGLECPFKCGQAGEAKLFEWKLLTKDDAVP